MDHIWGEEFRFDSAIGVEHIGGKIEYVHFRITFELERIESDVRLLDVFVNRSPSEWAGKIFTAITAACRLNQKPPVTARPLNGSTIHRISERNLDIDHTGYTESYFPDFIEFFLALP